MTVGSIEEGSLPLNQPAIYLGRITDSIDYEFDEDKAFGQHFVKTLAQNKTLSMGRTPREPRLGL